MTQKEYLEAMINQVELQIKSAQGTLKFLNYIHEGLSTSTNGNAMVDSSKTQETTNKTVQRKNNEL